MNDRSRTRAGGRSGGRRGGGREGRRAERVATAAAGGPAFITRQIPTYELLREDGLAAIEDAADTILAEIGVEFRGDEEALRLWREAGADVEGERVHFERGMVRKLVQATTPRQFTQHARNPARSVEIGGGNTVFSPSYGSPFVADLEGGRRYASLADFENFVRLAWMAPWLHHSGGTVCEPVDVPVNKRHLDMVLAHMQLSDKPFMGSVTAPERAADSVEMCRILFGAEFADANCVILGNINTNSPLTYDATMSGALRTYAAANQCTVVVPFILGGAMGPVTLAGAVAQSLAEAMVGVALTQLVRPGAPAILGNFLSSMSLRSGAPTFGMPEPALGYLAVGQLARRLGVPLRCGGAITASKAVDAQAAQESADSLLPTVMAGANFVMHTAGWLEGGLVMSYEKFMIDSDHLGMMHRLLAGMALDDNSFALDGFREVGLVMGYEKFMIDSDHLGMMHRLLAGMALDDNSFALDGFREVGPGHHFFGCAHTLANYETAFFDSAIADNQSFEQWTGNGALDAPARAHAAWRAALDEYEAPALDPGVDEALRAFVAERKAAVPDAWH